MEYLVTAGEMKTYDNNTIRHFGIEGAVLMERAAMSVCERVLREISGRGRKKRVLVLCGSGNNGGDGFAAARILHTKGVQVRVLFLGIVENMSEDCRAQYEVVRRYHICVEHARQSQESLEEEYDCIVDALFGVSLSRPVEGIYAEILARANQMDAYKVAVDLPSGIHADTGLVMGIAFRADETVTFAFLKTGLLLGDARDYCGRVVCADIGITSESFLGQLPGQFSYQREDLARIPARRATAHKGSFGKALLIAGSRQIGGACVLAAESLYRSGCGYVRVFTEVANRDLLLTRVPEAIVMTYKEEKPDIEALREACALSTVIVIGSGLSMCRASAALVEYVLKNGNKPLVVDADAINLISESDPLRQALRQYAAAQPVILTPHLAELGRFAGMEIPDLKRELLQKGLDLAREYHVILVAKGASTAVFDGRSPENGMDADNRQHSETGTDADDGRRSEKRADAVYINRSGNDGLATAGSGDVLTGIIGGMLAKGMDAMESACIGVYLHGLCADEAVRGASRSYLDAGDLTAQLRRLLE